MNYTLREIIDFKTIQSLLDDYCQAVGIAAAIIDLKGEAWIQSHWQPICADFHRKNEETCRKCIESDTYLANELREGKRFSFYQCRNGLMDAAAPIILQGEVIANVFVGQFFTEIPNREFFRNQAREYGFDEDAYLDAMAAVPIVPEEKLLSILDFLTHFTKMLAARGLERIQQKETETMLRESESKFRSLFETMTEGVALHEIVFDEKGAPADYRIVDVNPAYEKHTGLSLANIKSRLASEIYGASGAPYLEIFEKTVRTGQSYVFETYFGPMQKHFSISVFSPKKNWFATVFEDITERKRAEEEFKESERRFREMLETVDLVAVMLDEKGCVSFCNDYLLNLTGRTREEVIGQEWFSMFIPPDLIDEIKKVFFDLVRNEEFPHHHVNDIISKKGERRLISWDNTLVRDSSGQVRGVASLGRDITEQKRLEEQLAQSQKMDAIGQLAGGIAHDFNNLLTGILGFANILKINEKPGSKTYDAVVTIEKAAERAAELTRQLLGFARRGRHLSIPVNVNSIIQEVIKLLSRTVDKNIVLKQSLSSLQPLTFGDPNQIQQAILNLAVNARDALPNGGEIAFDTEILELNEKYCLSYFDAKPGKYVLISVSDDGVGIPANLQDRIFEPFFTTKDQGKGSGMGLAMVYGIVTNHGGYVRVYSDLGHGAVFKVYLPLHEKTSAIQTEAPSQPPIKGTGRILILDDEECVRLAARQMLELLGYDVAAAVGGKEGVEYYRIHYREIDLVIIDMVMPEMGGRECYLELKKIDPDVKAILSTGYGLNGRAQDILNMGILGFVQKPYKINDIANEIARILGRRVE